MYNGFMTITDTNGSIINAGDTLEILEDHHGLYRGNRLVVSERKWDEEDADTSLVATVLPSKFLVMLITEENAKMFRVV